MKMIELGFVGGKGNPISGAIKLLTFSKVSHCVLKAFDGWFEAYIPEITVSEPGKYYRGCPHLSFFEIVPLYVSDEDYDLIMARAASAMHKEVTYGYKEIVASLVALIFGKTAGRWCVRKLKCTASAHCSEEIIRTICASPQIKKRLEEAGVFEKDADITRPQELYAAAKVVHAFQVRDGYERRYQNGKHASKCAECVTTKKQAD